MKKFLLLAFFALTAFYHALASCPGSNEIMIVIVPDSWPTETSWDLQDGSGNILGSGTSVGDTICVPIGTCAIFTIHDSFGDGIYAPGGYWVYLNGTLVTTGNSFGFTFQFPIGCPQGSFCTDAIPLNYGTHTAGFDDTWYVYTAPQNGIYNLTTCSMNTCNTAIWVYSSCPASITEGPPGTYAYNDDLCGLQSSLDVIFENGHTYYIRIGDNLNDCSGNEDFTFSYVGPILGCMDLAACNYNPLATADDGSCAYFPSPICHGPDLQIDSVALITSLNLSTTTATTCDVTEGCVTGYGLRYVIQFSSKVNNIGLADYYIGNPSTYPGMFNLTNCHGHTHYAGYGDYRMYNSADQMIPAGHKNGFCVMDVCGGVYNCSNMGITAGSCDIYGAGTQCQWVDITDVPDGDYRLAAIINSQHLPDALGRAEMNYINNVTQVCINIHRTGGVPSFTLLPTCVPFVDCNGIPGGVAIMDCQGICAGNNIYGNLNTDSTLTLPDVQIYQNIIETNSGTISACNDLSGDGRISVYDAALDHWCGLVHYPVPASISPINPCDFPRNIVNPDHYTGLAISHVDFVNHYIDVEINSPACNIKAYQFKISGALISSVVSVADSIEFPVDIRKIAATNEVFALSPEDSSLQRVLGPQALCRIYYSSTTDSIICISEINDIINERSERTQTYTYGGCVHVMNPNTGIREASSIPLVLIPNPLMDKATLQIPEDITIQSIKVIDMLGKITSVSVNREKGKAAELDFRDLKPGLYILQVQSENKTGMIRFSKL